ncbi:MAG TPA: hypothetical protein VM054_08690 [bacterium]|nr:hypothetical protein [bacterium]
MRNSIKTLLALLCTLVLALVPGCASSTGDGDGNGDDHSLGWGRDLADAVRDEELPDGSLYNIVCIDVTDDGEPEEDQSWQFYYAELPGGPDEDVLIVTVQYNGSTFTIWETDSSLPLEGLPDYDDAGPWVEAAAEALADEGYPDWLPQSLVVEPYDGDDFPGTTNWAALGFVPPDSPGQATVAVDTDTNDVLDVEVFLP